MTLLAPVTPSSRLKSIAGLMPGVVLALTIAVASYLASPLTKHLTRVVTGQDIQIMPAVLALIFGAILHRFSSAPGMSAGLAFSIKKLLRWAIALFGLNVTIADILTLGWSMPLMVIVAMTATMVMTVIFSRLIGGGREFGALAGGACAVCGASAALAVSSVLPEYEGKETQTAFVAISVNLLATAAMVMYPILCLWLGLDQIDTGIFFGATIHDVAQVVGAGQAVSDATRDTAVIVKLFRVFLLLPVVLAVGLYFSRRGGGPAEAKVPIPIFAVMFMVFVMLNSWVPIPAQIKSPFQIFANWALLVAISALGLGTAPAAMLKVGFRNIAVVLLSTVTILFIPLVWVLLHGGLH